MRLSASVAALILLAAAVCEADADTVKVDTAKAFAGASSVVIGSFVVAFDIKKADVAKAGGGLLGNGSGGRSAAYSALTGVSDAAMQALTDAAYADFVAKAQAAGVTLVPRDALLQSRDFSAAKTYPNPYEDDQSTVMADGNDAKYFSPTGFPGVTLPPGIVGGLGGNLASRAVENAESKYAEDSGVRVLNVLYHVDFANAEKFGGWARSWSTVKVGAGIALPPGGTKYHIVGGWGGSFSTKIGTMTLNEPIGSNVDFATVTDTTSGATEATQTAANIFGALSGGGTNSSKHYGFAAREADYKTGVGEVLQKGNDTMIAGMKALQ